MQIKASHAESSSLKIPPFGCKMSCMRLTNWTNYVGTKKEEQTEENDKGNIPSHMCTAYYGFYTVHTIAASRNRFFNLLTAVPLLGKCPYIHAKSLCIILRKRLLNIVCRKE